MCENTQVDALLLMHYYTKFLEIITCGMFIRLKRNMLLNQLHELASYTFSDDLCHHLTSRKQAFIFNIKCCRLDNNLNFSNSQVNV